MKQFLSLSYSLECVLIFLLTIEIDWQSVKALIWTTIQKRKQKHAPIFATKKRRGTAPRTNFAVIRQKKKQTESPLTPRHATKEQAKKQQKEPRPRNWNRNTVREPWPQSQPRSQSPSRTWRQYSKYCWTCHSPPSQHRARYQVQARPEHNDPFRTRIIEPRTDHEDPQDPAGDYYWNHPGFLPPHRPPNPVLW